MTKLFKKQSGKHTSKKPEANKISKRNQYRRPRKGVAVCKKCHNVLFRKEWHRPGVQLSDQILLARKKGVHFEVCPACTMIQKKLYEGEIIISNMPARYEVELINLITLFGERARNRDPQDRVSDIKKRVGGYRITTTENQLAVKLAKKIKSVFNKVKIKISQSKEPFEVSRIKVNFL